jgi:hypothetical protein
MAKDTYHEAVRLALEQEGWTITDDPLSFSVGDSAFRIDLGAENCLSAERNGERIAVEIKTFLDPSPMHAFHEATGQYDNYLIVLSMYEPDRILYLAIPERIYATFFQREFVKTVVAIKKIRLIIYEPNQALILKWINS